MNRSGVFAALLIIFLVSGCKLGNLISRSESNAGNTNTGAPRGSDEVTRSGDPREDVIAASKKFTSLDSFSAKMTVNGKTEMNMEIAYIAPDRYHVKSSAALEFIIIGKDTYIGSGGGWKKVPGNIGQSIPKLRDSFTEEGMKSLKDVEYAGEETINGKDALLYKYQGTTVKDSKVYTSKLWIGKANGLPLKIEVEYPDGGPLKQMTTNYDYETKVTIEPPTTK